MHPVKEGLPLFIREVDIYYFVGFPGSDLRCKRDYVDHFINACSCCICTLARRLICLFSFVFFKDITLTAWFGLTAPLFYIGSVCALDFTPRSGGGEGEERLSCSG